MIFLAIDQISKFIYVKFHECAGKQEVVEAFLTPYTQCSPTTAWSLPTCQKTAMDQAERMIRTPSFRNHPPTAPSSSGSAPERR